MEQEHQRDLEPRLQRIDTLSALMARRSLDPRFPEPEESRFQRTQMPYRVQAVRMAILVAAPLYVLTSLLDAWLVNEVVVRASLARGLAILICLALTLMMRYRRMQRRAEAIGTLIALVLSSCQLYIASLYPPVMQPIHWLVNLLLLMYAVTVVHIRFSLAMALSAIVWLQTVIGLILIGGLSAAHNWYMAYFMLCGAIITLFGNYLIARSRRQRYLQRSLLGLHRQGLYHRVHQLQEDMGRDELTGLGNRHALERFLEDAFTEMARHREDGTAEPHSPHLREETRRAREMALILISVDHFQAFTHQYGHSEGDFCLATIARLMQRSVGGHGNFLARYGGEGFALVLPGATAFDGQATAERLRRDVEALGIPHQDDNVAGVVTISAGISHTSVLTEFSHQALLESADRALFLARQAGGNGCRRYQPPESLSAL